MMTLEKNTQNSKGPVGNQSNPLVMLIDDCEIDNFINERMLKRYELSDRIISYEKGSLALDYLADPQNEMPGYIFLDLYMPDMDGTEFLQKLDELSPVLRNKCEVVILSNSSDPKLKAKITSHSNVVAYFSKPLIKGNVDELLGKVSMNSFQAA
jgi:response regulator RpfG family c-di-GMP phosphodiesterase